MRDEIGSPAGGHRPTPAHPTLGHVAPGLLSDVAGWEKAKRRAATACATHSEDVVAEAEVGGASVIVTDTVRDVPVALVPSIIELQTTAEFARNTVAINPAADRRQSTGPNDSGNLRDSSTRC